MLTLHDLQPSLDLDHDSMFRIVGGIIRFHPTDIIVSSLNEPLGNGIPGMGNNSIFMKIDDIQGE